MEELKTSEEIPSPAEKGSLKEVPHSEVIPVEEEEETEKDVLKEIEKIAYTTISVPKPYGQKAKLYATLLRVNMVEFTCGA